MGKSKKNTEAEKATAMNEEVTRKYYGMAMPLLADQQKRGFADAMFPNARFIDRGLTRAGTMGLDVGVQAAGAQRAAAERGLDATYGANDAAVIGPAVNLASFRHGSALTQALADIRSSNSALGSTLGLDATGAEGAIGAARSQLQDISMLPEVDPALVAALAATDAGYGITRTLLKNKAGKRPLSMYGAATAQETQDNWARESTEVIP